MATHFPNIGLKHAWFDFMILNIIRKNGYRKEFKYKIFKKNAHELLGQSILILDFFFTFLYIYLYIYINIYKSITVFCRHKSMLWSHLLFFFFLYYFYIFSNCYFKKSPVHIHLRRIVWGTYKNMLVI